MKDPRKEYYVPLISKLYGRWNSARTYGAYPTFSTHVTYVRDREDTKREAKASLFLYFRLTQVTYPNQVIHLPPFSLFLILFFLT